MSVLRRRLGTWCVAWLLCQVATWSALRPLDCCQAHREAAADNKECHTLAEGDQCPMVGPDGAPCPMHQAGAKPTEKTCAIRGICQGPMAALGALFSLPGILTDTTSAAGTDPESLVVITGPHVRSASVPHDTPPPRA